MSLPTTQEINFDKTLGDSGTSERKGLSDGGELSTEQVVHFIGERAAFAVPHPPVGLDQDDVSQEVAYKILKRDGSLESIASAIQKKRTGVATTRVRNYAIDTAREGGSPGNYAFLRTVRDLEAGKQIRPTGNPLGQAARRRAYSYYKGDGYSHDADESRDVFGSPSLYPSDEYGEPDAVVEFEEMLKLLIDNSPSLQNGANGERNRELVEMYLAGYPLPEIASSLGIPHGTAKSIWRQFRLNARDILSSAGYEE